MKKFLASRGVGGPGAGWGRAAPASGRCSGGKHPPRRIGRTHELAPSGALLMSLPMSRVALRRVRRGVGPSNSPGDGDSSTASITLAFAPASRAASMLWITSIPRLKFLIAHALYAAGMLDFQLAWHEHCADFQIRSRRVAPNSLEHLAPMLLPVLRQIDQKALVERSAGSLR